MAEAGADVSRVEGLRDDECMVRPLFCQGINVVVGSQQLQLLDMVG